MLIDFFNNLWGIWTDSAGWLILGLLIAGFIKGWMPTAWLQRQLGGHQRTHIIKAALIGAPLPLCSCGVVPAALGLRQAGASKGATVSFLVATPETGPDSITLSYALLGPAMAIIRPIAAIFSAIVAGLLVKAEPRAEPQVNTMDFASGCSTGTSKSIPNSKPCCSTKTAPDPSNHNSSTAGLMRLVRDNLEFALGKMLADIAGWLLVGIILAAVMQTVIPPQWLAQWGSSGFSLLIMALIGVPMYICASASTPLAAGFLAAGLSPGAVLVFMLAGPATNIGTLGIVRQQLGNQALWAYLLGVVGSALLMGLITNYLYQTFDWTLVRLHDTDQHDLGLIQNGFGILLIGLMLRVELTRRISKKPALSLTTHR